MSENWRGPETLLALTSLPKVSAALAREYAEGNSPLPDKFAALLPAARERAQSVLAAQKAGGIIVLAFYGADYPPRLRALRSAPNLLFARGNVDLLRAPRTVAVVGTREPSAFGVSATATISQAFAAASFVTVSGLARGIDSVCARATLEAGGFHVAILGGGLDTIGDRALADEIVAGGGLILSEHVLGVPVRSHQLVARNRLQSGLADALIVGQTPVASGTMHTVRFAAEQGRPIFVAQPQGPHPASEGNHVLLETAAQDLPEAAPAFASTSGPWRQQYLTSTAPLARPITRENLAAVISEVASLADLVGAA